MIQVSNTGVYHSGSNATISDSIIGSDAMRDFFSPSGVLFPFGLKGGVTFGSDEITTGRYFYDLIAAPICNRMEVFTSGVSEWIVPSGVTNILVYLFGGGGGAGGGYTTSSGGRESSTKKHTSPTAGKGGANRFTRNVVSGEVYQVTIGAGGVGTNTVRGSGTNGGTTSMSLPNTSSIWQEVLGGTGSGSAAGTDGGSYTSNNFLPYVSDRATLAGIDADLYFNNKTNNLTLTGNAAKIYDPSLIFAPGSSGAGQSYGSGRGGMGGAVFILYGQ